MEIKRTIKKIAALVGGAVMAGATLAGAFAALDDLPQPFVTDAGMFDAYVVVGTMGWNPNLAFTPAAATGLARDVSVGMDVATAFGQVSSSAATGGGEVVTGGKQIKVPGDDFALGEDIQDIDDTYTDGDLGILADGTYSESKGNTKNNVDYTQKLVFNNGAGQLVFEKNTETDEEKTAEYVLFPKSTKIYDYKTTFTGGVDFDPAATNDDFDGSTLTLLGQAYTVSKASGVPGANFKLELLAGQVEVTQGEYTTQTYTLDGEDYEVEVLIVSDTTWSAKLKINGQTTDALLAGDTFTLTDGVEIGVREVLPNEGSEAAGADQVTFFLGAQKLTLEDTKAVKLNDETVDDWDSTVTFTGAAGRLDTINVAIAPKDKLYVAAGETWTDPIFGSWEVYFSEMTKDVEEITATSNGDDGMYTFMNLNGAELEIPFVLSDDASGHVTFGDEMVATAIITQSGAVGAAGKFGHMLVNDGDSCLDNGASTGQDTCEDLKMLVVGAGGEARILQITNIDATPAAAAGLISFEDLTSGKTWEDMPYTGGVDTFALDFGTITLTITEAAGGSVVANDINLYDPAGLVDGFKTSGGGIVDVYLWDSEGDTFTVGDDDATAELDVYDKDLNWLSWVTGYDDDAIIGVADGITGEVKLSKDAGLAWSAEEKDSDIQWARDATDVETKGGNQWYGAEFKYDNDNKDSWTAYLPDEQAYGKIYISETGKLATASTSGSVNVNYISTSGISKVDVDFDTAVPTKPVLLIGGPNVNKLVNGLAAANKTDSAADYVADTAIIQLIENAYGTKSALVVAGYDGKDTQIAGQVIVGRLLHNQFVTDLTGTKVTLNTASGFSAVDFV